MITKIDRIEIGIYEGDFMISIPYKVTKPLSKDSIQVLKNVSNT